MDENNNQNQNEEHKPESVYQADVNVPAVISKKSEPVSERMKRSKYKIFGQIILGFFSVLFLFSFIVYFVFGLGLVWINTPHGEQTIERQINASLLDTGYEVDFDALHIGLFRGVSIGDLKLSDAQGVFAQANDLKINLKLLPLFDKAISLSLDGGMFDFIRAPMKTDNEVSDNVPENSFTFENLYFERFEIERFSFDTLVLPEDEDNKRVMAVSPILKTSIDIDGLIAFSLNYVSDYDFYGGAADQPSPSSYPENISINIFYDMEAENFVLDNFSADAPDYTIRGSGKAGLPDTGFSEATDIRFIFDLPAFKAQGGEDVYISLFDRQYDTGSGDDLGFSNDINNTSQMHVADSDINKSETHSEIPNSEVLLTDINNTLFKVTTRYKGEDVIIRTPVSFNDQFITLSEISGQMPHIDIGGGIRADYKNILAKGHININVADFEFINALTGLSIKGVAKGNANLSYEDLEDAPQKLNLDAEAVNIQYQGVRIRGLDVSTYIPDLKSDAMPEMLDLEGDTIVLSPAVRFKSIRASIKKAEAPDQYAGSINADGTYGQKPIQVKGSLDIKTKTGANRDLFVFENVDAVLKSGASNIKINGRIGAQSVDLKAYSERIAFSDIPFGLPQEIRDSTLSFNTSITGLSEAPTAKLSAQVDLKSIYTDSIKTILDITGRYREDRFSAAITGRGDGIKNLEADVSLPMQISINPFIFNLLENGQLDGSFSGILDLKTLSAFLPVQHKMNGDLNAKGDIDGDIETPDISGNITLAKGAYTYEPYDLRIRDIALDARFNGSDIRIQNLSGSDNQDGRLLVSGRVDIVQKQNTALDVAITDFHAFKSERLNGTFSSDLDFNGRENGYLLAGTVNLHQFDIMIPERFQTNIPELNIVEIDKDAPEMMTQILLDVDVRADNQIFVRGWGLDAEFGGNIKVDGTLDDPQLDGVFKSKRGRYEEFGRRFKLEKANLRFLGRAPPSPYLEIKATTDADDIKASVLLEGTIENPDLKLTSNPSLPEDEIMAQILFGENVSDISPFQALQLKRTLDRFSGRGGGGFDPIAQLRNATGFDDIRVDAGGEDGPSVGVGKYIADNVYLELEKGAGKESGAAQIEIEVTPNVTVESEIGENAQAGGGVFWRWDY